MKILVTGANGMLGRTMLRTIHGHVMHGVDIDDCDITNSNAVQGLIKEIHPDAIIHCAAMTAVDDCESQHERAMKINGEGSANIARAAAAIDARLIAISTDYVFAGNLDRPYRESDEPAPRTVYGQSKLAGENAVREHCEDHLICRIAWLYGQGGPSFLHTMLRLGKEEGAPLKVVNDQIGNPTSCDAVAQAIARLLDTNLTGTMHLTCEGEATWYDFTREIFRLQDYSREVTPCASDEYPRPANSRLENQALRDAGLPAMPDWRRALQTFLETYPNGE